MKVSDQIAKAMEKYFCDKEVLEIACGNADFSISASAYAKEVIATDLSLERVYRKGAMDIPRNIRFLEMDAASLTFKENSFDAVVCYNALGHLHEVIQPVLKEMTRVVKTEGVLLFIATWKMDRAILQLVNDEAISFQGLEVSQKIEGRNYGVLVVQKVNT